MSSIDTVWRSVASDVRVTLHDVMADLDPGWLAESDAGMERSLASV